MKIIKKITSLILVLLLMTAMVFTLSSCENTSTHYKNIHVEFHEDFEMYLSDGKSKQLMDDMVKLSVDVLLEKENDITDKSNYDSNYHEGFKKYSYSVSIKGTLDAKYSGREITIGIQFIPEYHVVRTGFAVLVISENGTFSSSYTFNSNAILTECVPTLVTLY